jgi:two-component system response regulator HydG
LKRGDPMSIVTDRAPERVLVVDDDEDMAQCLSDLLTPGPFRVTTSTSAPDALVACRREDFGVVVSDIQLPGMNGIELMSQLKQVHPHLPVILVTGHATMVTASDAIRRGAYEYVTKPIDGVLLRSLVEEAAAAHVRGLSSSPALPVAPRRGRGANSEIIGSSPAMQALQARIDLVAASSAPVLIHGETGTGKELVARAIHARSARHKQPFITVNASAIPEALLESEMFGHARGAFTGATQAHRGYFAQADGGTLLLDEIGDMPLLLQAKLLRVLQAGEIHPVGSGRVEYVDVRILAATHRRLTELVAAQRFREDLFYRLNVVTITLPPLRARTGDIAELSRFFLARARERAPSAPATSIREDLAELLERRPWRGNVRELENMIERLVILCPDATLTPAHLALIEEEDPPAARVIEQPDACTIDAVVRSHVLATLARTGGNKARAAKLLDIDLSTLYRWQQKWRNAGAAFDA